MLATLKIKTPLFIALLLALTVTLVGASPAYAAENDCTTNGGTWSGADSDNGTCNYPSGNTVSVLACGSGVDIYEVTFEFDTESDAVCFLPPIHIFVPGSGGTRVYSPADTQTGFVLRLKGDHNGFVEFFDNTCINSCTIDSVLPDLARNSTIDTPLAAVYVRVDGGAGNGSYRVCFNNPYGEGLNLYQFIGGNWWLVNFSHSNPICATASGDGAFYLH
jgi:hypothetical protein